MWHYPFCVHFPIFSCNEKILSIKNTKPKLDSSLVRQFDIGNDGDSVSIVPACSTCVAVQYLLNFEKRQTCRNCKLRWWWQGNKKWRLGWKVVVRRILPSANEKCRTSIVEIVPPLICEFICFMLHSIYSRFEFSFFEHRNLMMNDEQFIENRIYNCTFLLTIKKGL